MFLTAIPYAEEALFHTSYSVSVCSSLLFPVQRRRCAERDELELCLRQKQQQVDRLEQQLLVEQQTSEHRAQAIALLEQQDLESKAQLMRLQAQVIVLRSPSRQSVRPGTEPNTPVGGPSQPSSLNDKVGVVWVW